MAIPTRNIIGYVLDPTGTGSVGGKIKIRLSSGSGTVEDDVSGDREEIGGEVEAVIGTDGAVDFDLVPNDEISPSGTRWIAKIDLPNGEAWEIHWNLASGSAIHIGDVPREDTVASAAYRYLVVTDESNLPAAGVGYRRWFAYIEGGTGEEDELRVCMKNSSDAWSWVPAVLGG